MPKQKQSEKDFIATARKRFQAASDDEKLLRDEALIDLKYVAGDQWDPTLKQQREKAGRPALTFPRCHTFVQQVSNEARQNKPQIKFSPGDDQADKDTAEIYEGLARHIQYSSDAQIAYETSVEYSAGGSFGYFRFLTDYADDETDDLELKIVPVLDPFAVYGILVPACFNREPRYGFVVEDVPKEEFEDLYPKSEIVTTGWGEAGRNAPGWIGTESARVAEYWYCEDTESDENKSGSRKRKVSKVKFCKMTGLEKLEDSDTDWMGKCIPIIPVLGKGMILQGKPLLFSVVRYQRSAQQMINYAKTRIAETLSTAPISPFIVARGQIAKGDKKWENLNTQVYPYIEYDQVDVNGKPAPPPERQTFEPPVQSLSGFVAQEIDDMKATTGIFDASLGQKSNETSGTAIIRRQQQSNMTTMHFMDNLERSFKKGGLIMQDMIPKLYDTERTIHILGADETQKVVRVNAVHIDEGGQQRNYKMGGDDAGKYQVVVTMGRAFSTKRMESFDMMSEVIQGNPQLMPMIGDIMFRNSDAAGADELADRFKKMLPPNLQDQEQGGDPEAQAQQLQAQNGQLQQHLQAINAYAQGLEKEKEGKVVENQGKVAIAQMQEMSRQEIVKMQEATKIAVAQINASKDMNEAIAQRELEQFKILHGTAHEAGMQASDQASAHSLADKQAQQDQQSQASDQQHQVGMADKQAEIASQQSDQAHAQTLEQQQAAAESQPAAGEKQ